MRIDTKSLQGYCRMIKDAVESGNTSVIGNCLELSGSGSRLSLNVTNREYYVSVRVPVAEESEPIHAVVDALLFLGLISKMTSKDIGLSVSGNSLQVKGNGSYRLPMVYDGGSLAELPEIAVDGASESFGIDAGILASILRYNSGELAHGGITQPVQKMHYVDENGAITFTSGACVNGFSLKEPVRMLLPDKVVKLFRLFGNEGEVSFSYSQGMKGSARQTKVSFSADSVYLASVIPGEDSMMESVPVKVIRGMADSQYEYSVSLSKAALIQACGRLLLLNGLSNSLSRNVGIFEFGDIAVTLRDFTKADSEAVPYKASALPAGTDVVVMLSLDGLRMTLDQCVDDTVVLSFGRDGNHMLLTHGNVRNIIPLVER